MASLQMTHICFPKVKAKWINGRAPGHSVISKGDLWMFSVVYGSSKLRSP